MPTSLTQQMEDVLKQRTIALERSITFGTAERSDFSTAQKEHKNALEWAKRAKVNTIKYEERAEKVYTQFYRNKK